MNKILPGIIAFCLLISISVQAQRADIGVKAGIAAGAPIGPIPEGASGAPGIGPHAGIFLRAGICEKLDLQSELSYSLKKASFHSPVAGDTTYEQELAGQIYLFPTYYEGTVDGNFANHYVEYSMLANYWINDRISIQGGVFAAYLLKGGNTGTADIVVGNNYSSVEDEPFDESHQVNEWDYGVELGSNYELPNGINFGMRFSASLNSLYKSSYTLVEGTIRNYYLKVYVGYKFCSLYKN